MEDYETTDSFVAKKPDTHPTVKPHQNSEQAQNEVAEKWNIGTDSLFAAKKPSLFKAVGIRIILLVIACSCFNGYFQQLGNRFMGPVFDYDQQYLERTLKNLGGSLLILSIPKGILEVAQTAEIEPSGATIKIGSIKLGQLIEPYMHIIDDIWDFLVFSTYLVILQMAALKFTSLIAFKFLLGFGALLCVIQYRRKSIFGKIGLSLIFLFTMSYVFYPLTLGIAAKTYEQHQIESSMQLSENLGVIKEQVSDIDLLSIRHFKDSLKSLPQILGQGLRTAWDATWGLVVGLILMFVMLPLFILVTIYIIGRQTMLYLDMPEVASNMDSVGRQMVNRVGSRSRTRAKLALTQR